jgi:hypothetical protein
VKVSLVLLMKVLTWNTDSRTGSMLAPRDLVRDRYKGRRVDPGIREDRLLGKKIIAICATSEGGGTGSGAR